MRNILIILGIEGRLRIVKTNPSSFQELPGADLLPEEKKMKIFAHPPVLYDGNLYCRNYPGDLIRVEMRK